MHIEKPKREVRSTTWALIGLLLMVIVLAGAAFAVGMTATDMELDCDTVGDPQDSPCSVADVNQPATLTRAAEEVILTRAVSMVLPTVTVTNRPTSIPPTSIPTKKVVPPTRTPGSPIRMAARPIIALSQCELSSMMDGAGSLIDKLNRYYEEADGPNNRIPEGATLTGPTVFWVNVGDESAFTVPENVTQLYTGNQWSAFLIRDGEYTITIGKGGRYIGLIAERECPLFE